MSTKAAQNVYVGVDVGGTKILAALVKESGAVLGRKRHRTPRGCKPEKTVSAIEAAVADLLKSAALAMKDVTAMGIAAAGVVDPREGRVVFTPNMNLTGVPLGKQLEDRYSLPVALGNDCNLGTLGEKWLGSARDAKSAFGMFIGTGIGGGYVRKGRLLRGHRETASEVGHMVMQIGGPKCGCGNRGCFEALASRTAIERGIRQAADAGRKTVLSELLDGDLSVIRSGSLKRALALGDALVAEGLRRAAEIIGAGCLTVRHLLDPEVIVLGGGVMEACGDFMMPIVETVLAGDGLRGARTTGRVLLAALGDDAVALGAVALARARVNRSPFKKRFKVLPEYPEIVQDSPGEVRVGHQKHAEDIYIRVNGLVKRRKKETDASAPEAIDAKEAAKICKGGPEIVFIGTGLNCGVHLSEEAQDFLRRRAIEWQAEPTEQAVKSYNLCKRRKAALLHLTT